MRRHRNLLAGLFLVVGLAIGAWFGSAWWRPAQTPVEPKILRPAAESTGEVPAEALREEIHPLDPALQLARECLDYVQSDVVDYEATLVKRERVGEQLAEPQEMFLRLRNRKVKDGVVETPLSVYLRFTEPKSLKGQQVLWVEGQNANKMLARAGGTLGRLTPAVWLAPNGPIAMRGNRYSIDQVGIENLVAQLIEKGERDRQHDECEVEIADDTLDGRDCTRIEVRHPEARPHFDFHIARIYLDRELKVPVRYAAYTWPKAGSQEPELLEEYTYRDLKLNVGLSDADFDAQNSEYGF